MSFVLGVLIYIGTMIYFVKELHKSDVLHISMKNIEHKFQSHTKYFEQFF